MFSIGDPQKIAVVTFDTLQYLMLFRVVATGDEPLKSICRILGPLAKKPTLGSQHAVEAGYLKCMCLFVLAFYQLSVFFRKSPNLSLEKKQ